VTRAHLTKQVSDAGAVVAVASSASHRFSKDAQLSIRLVKDHGVEGDAHAGPFIRHRYLARQQPLMPNNRQVHLIQSELFEALHAEGFDVGPGDLGENVTTRGIDLLKLPVGSLLYIGSEAGPCAVVELTGLRTPCGMIDKFKKGLKRAMIVRTPDQVAFRAGVMGVVRASGEVGKGDAVGVELPRGALVPLPAID
jgi:MOSC domain-containing protein YiiM